jgi:hypothetical protein
VRGVDTVGKHADKPANNRSESMQAATQPAQRGERT